MINAVYFLAVTLIFVRLTSFFLSVKIFFPKGTPPILKGTLSLIISLAIISGIDYSYVSEISNNYELIISILNEIMTGIILGTITSMLFEMIRFAGALMDMQAGLSMVQIVDPTTSVNSTVLSNLLYTISMMIFFVVDGHHLLLKCLIRSFSIVPIGQSVINGESVMVVVQSFIDFFTLGLKIAIPLVLIIIITDLCMALVSRAVPAINVMILGMPVKIIVGLLTFIVILPLTIKIVIIAIGNLPDIFEKIFKTVGMVPIAFIFSGEKTEEATPKKKADAKKKGQVPRSKEIGLALSMLTCTFIVLTLSEFVVGGARDTLIYFLSNFSSMEVNELTVSGIAITVLSKIAMILLPVVVPIMIVGVVASLLQTGIMFTGEGLKPKFSKLNPMSGFKNMFSKKSFVDLIKNLIVVSIIAFVGYKYITSNYDSIIQMGNLYLPTIGTEVKSLVIGIFTQISMILVAIAAIDYFVQIRFHQKDMRMSKQEVKEEYKQMEGDPHIKGKIKQKQREMATGRMMQAVGDATVVITNPTHIAVAIKYDEGNMEAPKIVAMGVDHIALKIKEEAKKSDVPIIENKPLARLIYEKLDVEDDIPQDMYQAVAEILVLVFKMKKNK
ncbi:MAG: fused FliR family export protein/FlhB family type III secretion system protein [Clostridium sp.]